MTFLTDAKHHILDDYIHLFWSIGYFGAHISILYALYVSYAYSFEHLISFIVTILLIAWSNHAILKEIIYDPRPSNSTPFLASDHLRKNTNGMPSGHAQNSAFALTFSYLLTGKRLFESLGLFFIIILQRYVYKNHTIPQLLVGGILGFVTAYLVLFFLHRIQLLQKSDFEKNETVSTSIAFSPNTPH